MKPTFLTYNESIHEIVISGEHGEVQFYFLDRERGLHIRQSLQIHHPSKETSLSFHCLTFDKNETYHQRIFAACGQSINISETGGAQITCLDLAHNAVITALCCYQPLEMLVSASADGVIKVWDALWQLHHVFVGHTAAITCLLPYPSPACFVSAAADNTLRVWNLATLDLSLKLDAGHSVTDVLFMPSEPHMLITLGASHLALWNISHLYHHFAVLDEQVWFYIYT